MELKKFEFYTQYNQFYLSSVGKNFDTDNDDMESFSEDMTKRLGSEKNALIIFTESYGNIKGDIQVLAEPSSQSDFHKYDHVVEAGIETETGELQILDCPNSHTELSLGITPGKYRVRIYSSNLKSVKERDLANDTDDDYYHIEIWPSSDMQRKVLKQYHERN